MKIDLSIVQQLVQNFQFMSTLELWAQLNHPPQIQTDKINPNSGREIGYTLIIFIFELLPYN